MSQLTDAIREAGIQTVARAIQDEPDFQVFNLLWSTPEELIPACDKMGWQTLDELLAWVQSVNAAVGKTSQFVQLIDPPVGMMLAGLPTVDMPTIHKAIVDQAMVRDDFFIDQSDATYCLPSKAQWEHLVAICPVTRRRWVATTFDCDDFANMFRGWLASNGLGNLAQGFCGITLYDLQGNLMGGHAVVLVMDDTHKLWFLDPQAGRLFEVTYPRLGGFIFAKSVRIARAYF